MWLPVGEKVHGVNNTIEYYRGRRVLVTGHTGFKGSWLAIWLKHLGAEVCGIALPPGTQPNMYTLTGVSEEIDSYDQDICETDRIVSIMKHFAPEIVFHMAAQALVRQSYSQPLETYRVNVMGTAIILNAIVKTPSVRGALIVTSDKVYMNNEQGKCFLENDQLGGLDPYSSSKACAELLVDSWRSSYCCNPDTPCIASARAGNVIGGGDWSENRLVPDITRAIDDDRPVILRNPQSVRPWQHVLEVLWGYLMLGEKLGNGERSFAEAWNFGPSPNATMTVEELALRFVKCWGKGSIEKENNHQDSKEANLLQLDSAKSTKRLLWHPIMNLDCAIAQSVHWYRTVLDDPTTARNITMKQVGMYQDCVSHHKPLPEGVNHDQ